MNFDYDLKKKNYELGNFVSSIIFTPKRGAPSSKYELV